MGGGCYKARISSVLVYYESLVDDPETVVDLISGMLFDEKRRLASAPAA